MGQSAIELALEEDHGFAPLEEVTLRLDKVTKEWQFNNIHNTSD
jgi:hypothetical protein